MRSSVQREWHGQMKTVNQQLLARKRERMKPLSEHERINELLRNEFVSQQISAVRRASLEEKLSIARLTWPTETSQPTISRSKPRTNENIIETKAHKTVTSKRLCVQTNLSCHESMYPGEAQHCQSNLANWELATNKLSLGDSKEPFSKKHTQQQVDSTKVCVKVDHRYQSTPSQREAQYCETNLADWTQPTNNFLQDRERMKPLSEHKTIHQILQNECRTTDVSCQKSKSQSQAQYFEVSLDNWDKPTNNFSHENANEWNHYRNTSA